jgi:hypothetical protein
MAMEKRSRLNADAPGADRRQVIRDAINVMNAERLEKIAKG